MSVVHAGGDGLPEGVQRTGRIERTRARSPFNSPRPLCFPPTATATEMAYLGGRAGLAAPLMGPESVPSVAPLAQPVTTTHRVISYTYDSVYQLTGAEYSTGEFYQYAYDAVGNRLTYNGPDGTKTYVYDDANRLTSVNAVGYTWDNNGNLLNDGVRSYSYDHANRLTQVVSGTLSTGFTYNGAGDRVAKTVDGVTTDYVLDPAAGLPQVLQDTTAGQTQSYLYGLDLLAQYDSGTWAYHVSDGLGSVRQLADPMGQVVQSHSFSPFGVPLGESGGEPYGFTGEQWDASAGLVFLRARYYQPGVGRFTQPDPWRGDHQRPLTLNPYLYVLDNPVNATDPSGWYGREVHYDLTLQLVLEIAPIVAPVLDPDRMAYPIAWADQWVDDPRSGLDPVFGCRECHFCPLDRTFRHVGAAVKSGNPFLFGASLHQLQDWFSHWNEGYRPEGLGHFPDSERAGKYRGGRTQEQLDDFYKGKHLDEFTGVPISSPFPAHPREEKVIPDIQRRNPGINLNGLSDNDLIDLYLRRDPGDPMRVEERSHFGLDTDRYFEGSSRDRDMEALTRAHIWWFLARITDTCKIDRRHPKDSEIKLLLTE